MSKSYELSIDPIEIPEDQIHLFKDAHSRSLDNILSHPLKAEDIEDLCEALGFYDYAEELKQDRKRQEEDDA